MYSMMHASTGSLLSTRDVEQCGFEVVVVCSVFCGFQLTSMKSS